MDHQSSIQQASKLLYDADYLLITAGAGLSADSGLPVFATLSSHPVLQAAGMTYDQVVSGTTLARDAAFFFGFYASAAGAYAAATPHEGYAVLKDLVERMETTKGKGRVLVLTTNVDNMFKRLGVPAIELHGSATRFQCGGRLNRESRFPQSLAPRCSNVPWEAPPPEFFEVDAATLRARQLPPPCARCGGAARPNIYLFGDGGAFAENDEENARWQAWREEAARAARGGAKLVVLEVGAGLRVPVLRKRGEELCSIGCGGGGTLIRVNPDYAQQSMMEASVVPLPMTALAALKAIDEHMRVLSCNK